MIILTHVRFFVALLACFTASPAVAFDFNDCIINGMKGISSDLAARQIRMACLAKYDEYKDGRLRKLAKEYGEAIDNGGMYRGGNFQYGDDGFHSMKYTNVTGDKTITFVRLRTAPAPAPGTQCDFNKQRVYAYKITVKPRESITLFYPSSAGSECSDLVTILGKPSSWKDVSFSSTAKPLDNDPFAELN